MKYLKLGNTEFRSDLGNLMSFSQCKKLYANRLKVVSLEDAYKKLGGKIASKNEK